MLLTVTDAGLTAATLARAFAATLTDGLLIAPARAGTFSFAARFTAAPDTNNEQNSRKYE